MEYAENSSQIATSQSGNSQIIKSRGIKRKTMSKYKQEERGEDAPVQKKRFNGRGTMDSEARPSVARSSYRQSVGMSSQGRSTYTYYTETCSKESKTVTELDYEKFLTLYGHIDFDLIDYLPEIKSTDELRQIRKQQLKDTSISHKYAALKSNGSSPHKKASDLTIIKEAENEEFTETNNDSQMNEIKGEIITANRFDFTLNDQYYVSNIKIDKYGERIETRSDLQGRVVAKECIWNDTETEYAEERKTEDDGITQKSKITLQMQKSKFYFQWRIDEMEEDLINPKVCIGVCKDDFMVNQDLSRQKQVWCINLATGDKFNDRKWKDYYNIEDDDPVFGDFEVGTVVGVLVDIDRGMINFYKDGNDLGTAFILKSIQEGFLYPFVQLQVEIKMSIFHPFVYPEYRAPLQGNGGEEGDFTDTNYRSSYRSTTKKSHSFKDSAFKNLTQKTPDDYKAQFTALVADYHNPSATDEKRDTMKTRKSVSFMEQPSLITPKTEGSEMRGSDVYDSSRNTVSVSESELQRRLEHEKQLIQTQDQLLEDMRMSHIQMQESAHKSIKVNNVQMNLADIDLKKLTEEQAQDIKEIEDLQTKIEEMAGNLTLGDVSAVVDLNYSVRPSFRSNGKVNTKKTLNNLQYEITKYQKEIELVKLKLQFKQQIIAYKNEDGDGQSQQPPMGMCGTSALCGMGSGNQRPNGSLECVIF